MENVEMKIVKAAIEKQLERRQKNYDNMIPCAQNDVDMAFEAGVLKGLKIALEWF